MNYFSYLKEAFLSQINLVVVAGFGLFSLVSWNWLPLIVGSIGEALYLAVVPNLPWYHRRLAAKAERQKLEASQEATKKILDTLPHEDREHFKRLVSVSDEIKRNYQSLHPATKSFLDSIAQQHERLLSRFLTMKQAQHQSEQYLASTRLEELQEKLARINTELAEQDSRIQEVQQKQKTILEKRLEKRAKVEDNNKVLGTQLETIEQFLFLMKDQSLSMRDPGEVAGKIESMLADVESTESTVRELEGFFGEE